MTQRSRRETTWRYSPKRRRWRWNWTRAWAWRGAIRRCSSRFSTRSCRTKVGWTSAGVDWRTGTMGAFCICWIQLTSPRRFLTDRLWGNSLLVSVNTIVISIVACLFSRSTAEGSKHPVLQRHSLREEGSAQVLGCELGGKRSIVRRVYSAVCVELSEEWSFY